MFRTMVLVAIGGGIGSALRYLTSVLVNKYFHNLFPLATLLTNVLGCFLIGIFMGLIVKSQVASEDLKWLLVTGFCGGYTTFSAFGYENISLLQTNHSALVFANIGISIAAGLGAAWLGLYLTK